MDVEKLGAFYLGRRFDRESRRLLPDPILYDAKDLTTHALVVGMTGSGKTGLSVVLLEEAAIDGIPALVIDPKGDMGNLLLTFSRLRGSDFRPWIDEREAARQGSTPDELAERVAEEWRRGLAAWGQTPERIARFESSVERIIYTPGSTSGAPVALLRSLGAPSAALAADEEALRERITTAASGLLGLVGLSEDPLRSREHILVSLLLERAWSERRDLDLPRLIEEIQSPPFETMGAMDLETFYPREERFRLAASLNHLLASPGFSAWREGEPLDVPRLLFTEHGKPRLAIFTLSHLSDAERMFFVTLLLNEVIGWMRTLAGTGSLRALLYMDEIFGFFPPSASPPSKLPMLTLLKQARAYGLGVVLATQNPVDLDYKGLSNAGTWLLGRLQTERDKQRVLDGLEGASKGTGLGRAEIDRLLSGLDPRVFLMHNVHEDKPVVFQTRWALSYLSGPLRREQIQRLMKPRVEFRAEIPSIEEAPAAATEPPAIPAEIPRFFLPAREPSEGPVTYRPFVLGSARLHFVSSPHRVDHWQSVSLLAPLSSGRSGPEWEEGGDGTERASELSEEPREGARFGELPAPARDPKSYEAWKKSLSRFLYERRTLDLWKSALLRETSEPGEDERSFRSRIALRIREHRDEALESLRRKMAPRLARWEERVRKAEARLEREKKQYDQQKYQTAVSLGATLLGALLGRKLASAGSVGRATTTARSAGRAAREREDIARAEADLARAREELAALEAELREQTEALAREVTAEAESIEKVSLRPRKSDVAVTEIALVWVGVRS